MKRFYKYDLEIVREKRYTVETKKITCPEDIFEVLKVVGLHKLPREKFYMVALDNKNEILGIREVSSGTISSTLVHPREVFQVALMLGSARMIVAHNHPSGDVTPSSEDIETTNRLIQAGEILGVSVVDHIIVGDGFLSFKAEGLI